MMADERNIGDEILQGLRELKRGEHGRITKMRPIEAYAYPVVNLAVILAIWGALCTLYWYLSYEYVHWIIGLILSALLFFVASIIVEKLLARYTNRAVRYFFSRLDK